MDTSQWWKNAVVYQIYPRSFADSTGDGMGDLAGITARLDYVAKLGVDVIWLSPAYRSPQDDNGYDISDYEDIDPVFGSLEDIDALFAGAHARGMKVVMDLVVNHTSDEHVWFEQSRSSRNDPKRDWYWWRPARPGFEPGSAGAEPNNWASAFSGPAWQYDAATGEYYLHLFSSKQPDLNWENTQVRQAVYAMMRWWLDRGADGFRMDVINLISKDPSLPDGPVPEGLHLGDGRAYFICGPRIHEFLAEMHQEVFFGREGKFLTVGEMPSVTVDEAQLFTDPDRREVDMVFQFEHVDLDQGLMKFDLRPLRLIDLKASFGRWQLGLAEKGWNSLYWNNHDQPRAVSRFGDDSDEYRVLSAKLLGAVLHLHRGTPYVYQGEELGMTNFPFESIDQFRDIESLNYYREAVEKFGLDSRQVLHALGVKSRDNARTPMQWDDTPNAGFTTGDPWIAVNPNHRQINARAQQDDPDSVFSFYRSLIDLRHSDPVVAHGDFSMLVPQDEHLYAFTRRLGEKKLLVVANFSAETRALPEAVTQGWESAQRVLGNYPPLEAGLSGDLGPWEVRICRTVQ